MRRPLRTLTRGELRVMRALWKLGDASVAELVGAIGRPKLAHTTVSTVLTVLENKSMVKRDSAEKAHRFIPLLQQSEAENAAIVELVQGFFENNKRALALRLLSDEAISSADLQQITQLLEEAEVKDDHH